MMATSVGKEHLLELLDVLPLGTIKYACAYGSGTVPQKGEDRSTKMVDFIVATSDANQFHEANIERNPGHYSFLRYLGHKKIAHLQNDFAAAVYCNTLIHCKGRLIKYNVINVENLEKDLLRWKWLYLAGRLQKYVVELISPNESLLTALKANHASALQAALLLLPEQFSLEELYTEIVTLSYRGDFRMFFGEDKNKIKKIVAGNRTYLEQLYMPLLKADNKVSLLDQKIIQDASSKTYYDRVICLPLNVLHTIQRMFMRKGQSHDIEELLQWQSLHLDNSKYISMALAEIVRQSAWKQTVKNALTAGFSRSLVYSFSKIGKMFKSLSVVASLIYTTFPGYFFQLD